MPAPILAAQGSIAANTTGSLTVTLPAHQADDILVLCLVFWGPNTTGDAAQIPTPSGWTQIGSQIGQPAGTRDGWAAWFWKRAASSAEPNPVCARGSGWDTGTDTCFAGRAYTIRGCDTAGNPWDAIASAGPYTAANGAVAAVTVSGSQRTVIHFFNSMDDQSAGAISGWTAGTAATTATGTDAGFQTFRKENVSASTGADASTAAAPVQGAYAYMGVAFKPAPTRGRLAWAELEVPMVPTRGLASWLEAEAPLAPTRGCASWLEQETPLAPTRGLLSWGEGEVPTLPTRGLIAWLEGETPLAPTRGQLAWTEAEAPSPTASPTKGLLSWAETEIPLRATRGLFGWAELETPLVPTRGLYSWGELEAPFLATRGWLAWAEAEVPLVAVRGLSSWLALEVPLVPTRGATSWAELEAPTAPTRGRCSWLEASAPVAPTRGLLSWTELYAPLTSGGPREARLSLGVGWAP